MSDIEQMRSEIIEDGDFANGMGLGTDETQAFIQAMATRRAGQAIAEAILMMQKPMYIRDAGLPDSKF